MQPRHGEEIVSAAAAPRQLKEKAKPTPCFSCRSNLQQLGLERQRLVMWDGKEPRPPWGPLGIVSIRTGKERDVEDLGRAWDDLSMLGRYTSLKARETGQPMIQEEYLGRRARREMSCCM